MNGGKVPALAALIGVVLALLGGVYSIARTSANIERQLDRNCDYIQGISFGLKIVEARLTTSSSPLRRARTDPQISAFPEVRC